MKILIIANGYPDAHSPQWGCFERDQAIALKDLGHEVSILYVDRRFRPFKQKFGISRFEDNGIRVFGLFFFPGKLIRKFLGFKLHKLIVSKWYMRLFRCYVRSEGLPNIVYAHYLYNIFYASILKDKYGIPVVGIEHWSELTKKELSKSQRYWGENGYAKADRILSVSKSLQSHIKRHFGIDSTVVYDMLGPEFISNKFYDTPKSLAFRFIAVGSLLPIKGYDMLVKAFKLTDLKEKGCSLSIVGEGKERQILEQIIKELDLSSSVSLLGRKTKKEIVELLFESNAFVLSSKNETFGVACIEALSQGLPAIATRCGGPEEFITDNNGMLVQSDDVNALASAMLEMYENYSRYDRQAIAEDCRRRFSPEVIARQLSGIFEEVMKEHDDL